MDILWLLHLLQCCGISPDPSHSWLRQTGRCARIRLHGRLTAITFVTHKVSRSPSSYELTTLDSSSSSLLMLSYVSYPTIGVSADVRCYGVCFELLLSSSRIESPVSSIFDTMFSSITWLPGDSQQFLRPLRLRVVKLDTLPPVTAAQT